MITRNLIDITNHPTISNITRKAQVFRSYDEYDTNRIIIPIKIFHYLDGIEQTYFPNYYELIGGIGNFVNPINGNLVEKDEEGNYPEGSVPEYDYLWNIVNVLKNKTQIELEEIYVILRIDKLNTIYN